MKRFCILVLACTAAFSATNEIKMHRLTIGTNTYDDVVITRRNSTDAVVRFSGGVAKVPVTNLTMLPEPIGTEWRGEAVAAMKAANENAANATNAALEAQGKAAAEEEEIRRAFRSRPPTAQDSVPVVAERSEEAADTASGIGILIFVGVIYFLPWFIARSNKHRNASAIFLLNLFLGWTLLGWVAALVWAVTKTKHEP